jgi:aryl-alcohol dehydrogenase-like predicted oxidoreductase
MKYNGVAERLGLHCFICGQYLYNLIDRGCEREVLPACADQGMGFAAWSPLGGGLLSGKYNGIAEPPPGTRAAHRRGIDGPRFWHDRGIKLSAALHQLAIRTGISASDLALGWIIKNRQVSAVVLGVRTGEQLKKNLSGLESDLPVQVGAELDELTTLEPDQLDLFASHARRNVPEAEF